MPSKTPSTPERFTLLISLFALLLGIGCGVLHVLLETLAEPDPLIPALAVTMATMLLGTMRPLRPWRWVLLVGVPVPVVMWAAHFVMPAAQFTRAAIAGSLLISLPGCAGAYGGSVLRRKIVQIFYEDNEEELQPPARAANSTEPKR
jgi:hypothetical protein